jgi:hypothetical protein
VNVSSLMPRRHAPPEGWPSGVFEKVTDAIAAALVAAVRRGPLPVAKNKPITSESRADHADAST